MQTIYLSDILSEAVAANDHQFIRIICKLVQKCEVKFTLKGNKV